MTEDHFPPKRRRSIRLPEYDHSQPGAYFITICAYGRSPIFGRIIDGVVELNAAGRIIRECWLEIPRHFPNVKLGEYVIMPNHVHMIIWIRNQNIDQHAAVGARHAAPLQTIERFGKPVHGSIPTIIRSFKSAATKLIRQLHGIQNQIIWQRNYYEHVIRDDEAYEQIAEYILANPARWQKDKLFQE